jgi:ribonuclease BN (tRNA processing enzyme)
VIDFKVLGCHGGQLAHHRTTTFLLDGVLALDAGTICQTLTLEEIARIDHVLLTHSHFDHIKDVPLLADLLTGRRDRPVIIHASPACVAALKQDIFNDRIWPDFTAIPNEQSPVIRLEPFEIGKPLKLGAYTVHSVPVTHPVESVGFILEKGKTLMAMSGDTGPTDALWEALRHTKNLKALMLETSFPNALQRLADQSGHLTPHSMSQELENKLKDRNGLPIYLYHLKPAFTRQLHQEIATLRVPGLRVLELDQTLQI